MRARSVEPVRTDEERVAQAQLLRLRVHLADERVDVAATDVRGERVSRVVGALDQRCLDEIAHGHLLAGAEADRRLADGGGRPLHGHDVAELDVLERDEHGHQLRDARDHAAGMRLRRREHLAGLPVHDEVALRLDGRRARCMRRRRERERRRGTGQEPLHQPETAQISSRRRAASKRAAARQSPPRVRNA
jgi:hypothetical protein